MAEKSTKNIKIFYSYSHKDEKLRKKLETQLSLLKQQGLITNWYDHNIGAGTEWAKEIHNHLDTADIILLLISPDFLASDYCFSVEMKRALERHERGEARVIPVILRPVFWQGAPFGKLKALPKDAKPVTGPGWHNQDEAFFNVVEGIRKAIEELVIARSSDAKGGINGQTESREIIRETDSTSPANKERTFPTNPLAPIFGEFKEPNQIHPRILIIDDEENVVELIRLGLRYEGFQVESASDGLDGISAAQRFNPDLIILDLFLPDMDGLEICRRLRANPATKGISILILTSKDDVRDRIQGLNIGADDYLTKPFDFEELVARVNAILRRYNRASEEAQREELSSHILQFADLQLNTKTREATRCGRLIELTATEYNLLHLFMSHPRQVLDRQTILNRVWGYDFMGETNIIEVYVRYLREKIEDSPSTPKLFQTVRGVGYVLKG